MITEQVIGWQYNNRPPESGYFLAAWKYVGSGRSIRVSEFWFDGTNWWTGREYIYAPYGEDICGTYEQKLCITEWIIAWMPKPKYVRPNDS